MDKFKIVSLNVRGINNNMKRRKIFTFLKRSNADVCFLQETFSCKDKESIWTSEWGSKCIFAHGQSNSCGVAIMFKRKPVIEEIVRDLEGRKLHVKIKINEHTYGLSNIYAPNHDNPSFFEDTFNEIHNLNCTHNVVGGDFNVIQDPKLDRNVDRIYHKRSHEVIKNFKNSNDYCDLWRARNPDKKVFTYMASKERLAWSRIDYFLTSNTLQNNCIKATIEASVSSDHSLIGLEIMTEVQKRGPGVWKLNNTLLTDDNFIDELKNIIKGCKRMYNYMRPSELWDLIKFEIKQFARDWSKHKMQNEKSNKFKVYLKLNNLQNDLAVETITNQREMIKTIDSLKLELDCFETMDARRAAFRCKKSWVQGGEKMSKYYFGLEKRNHISKTMYVVRRNDGSLTKDYSEILNLQHDFYENLYSSNANVAFNLNNNTGIVLSNELRNKLEETISIDEIFDAMMTLKSNKCPGMDGLSLEMYRCVWSDIKEPLYNYYMEALSDGQFCESSRRGLINLIPKASSKDDFLLKNWRPIVLLNVDLKLWSKAIANRLEETIDLIGKQQTGFMKNRSIFTNILTTMEVVSHLNKENRPGIIVAIDFNKCFDRVEFKSIEGTFKYFGFGDRFLKMLLLLFSGLKMCTSSNGFTSSYFNKCRGTNQGDPASPLIYSFCGEIMAHLIMNNPGIKGIDLHGIKKILSQFADDTAAYLSYERITLDNFINTLTLVEAQLGLQVSYEKTTIYRVGSLYKSNAKLFTQNDFVWSDDPISLLGVKIPCNGVTSNENLQGVMRKLHQVCDKWINRQATIFGKIVIINALMGSLFVYKMSTMMFLQPVDIANIEKIIRRFLWNGKKAKISLFTLMKRKQDGGLRLVNLAAKQQTIKISWVYKLDNFLETCLYKNLNDTLQCLIWKCNIKKSDVKKKFGSETFWSQMLLSWSDLNFHVPDNKKGVLSQLLWYNSHIKIKGEIICWKHWVDKNILTIEDIVLLEPVTRKKSSEELTVNWLELQSLWDAIPKEWIRLLEQRAFGNFEYLYDILFRVNVKQRNKKIYDMIIADENYLIRYQNRWLDKGVEISSEQ